MRWWVVHDAVCLCYFGAMPISSCDRLSVHCYRLSARFPWFVTSRKLFIFTPEYNEFPRRVPLMKFILILASVTLSSHTFGVEKPCTPCEEIQDHQATVQKQTQKPPNPEKWVPREAPW
jgi:hypothetical protein